MNTSAFSPSPQLIEQACQLVTRLNASSISLLQRHFRLGYQAALALADTMEAAGILSAPTDDGSRTLTPFAHSLRHPDAEPTPRELFEAWACDPFEGGDGGDAGSSTAPSIWVFAIEHGNPAKADGMVDPAPELPEYTIDKQLTYTYNRNAFKLFAAIEGELVENYIAFARRHQPWVPGSAGYLKGNLYPYPCRRVSTWTDEAIADTGFEHKEDMVKWCNENRLPAIHEMVRRHRPRLFIGVGASLTREFTKAYLGAAVPLDVYQFAVNGYTKKIRYATHNGAVFVVLPHLSGGSNSLNSDAALQIAGSFIAGLMR